MCYALRFQENIYVHSTSYPGERQGLSFISHLEDQGCFILELEASETLGWLRLVTPNLLLFCEQMEAHRGRLGGKQC